MAVRPLGGYDPGAGWPPDDSTGIDWGSADEPVDLPGNFGRGGFHGPNARITGPAAGPARGVSLSGPPPGAVGGSVGGVNMSVGPENGPQTFQGRPPVNPNPVGRFTNPFTDAHINPATGQPEFVGGPNATIGPGSPAASGGFPNLLGWLNPVERAGIAAGAVMQPTPTANDAAPTNMWNQRPSGVGGQPGPQVTNPAPYQPFEAGFPTPTTGGDPRTGEGVGWGPLSGAVDPKTVPPPIGSPAPAMPPRRVPRSAGPAAAKQQPNLGAYAEPPPGMIYRPNADAAGGGRGPRNSSPYMGVADLSKLFSRQP